MKKIVTASAVRILKKNSHDNLKQLMCREYIIMFHKSYAVLLAFLLIAMPVFADSTQQYNKLLLSPYYLTTLGNNVNTSFLVTINPPDNINNVLSAIVNFQTYSSGQTVNYTLWVNDKKCNTPDFLVSTTFSSSGIRYISFDCSNIITANGTYNVTLRPSGAVGGATSGWIDFTYMNRPKATAKIFGTEYVTGDHGKVWLQVTDANNNAVDNAQCYADIYTPANMQFLERVSMVFLEDGVYYYDLTIPQETGVYPVVAVCYYVATQTTINASSGQIYTGTDVANNYNATWLINQIYWDIDETNTGNPRRIEFRQNYTNITQPILFNGFTISWTGIWNSQVNDNLVFWVYNFSSATWIELTNQVLDTGTGEVTVSNNVQTDNLTRDGFLFNKTMVIMVNDTNSSDATKSRARTDQLIIQLDSFSSPQWQKIIGSGEIHVQGDPLHPFLIETFCGLDSNDVGDSACMQKYEDNNPENTFSESELTDNITIYSVASVTSSGHWEYETPSDVDCSAIYSVELFNGTDYIDVSENTTFASNLQRENCLIRNSMEFLPSPATYEFRIITDNYLLWELNWTLLRVQSINTSVGFICDQAGSAYSYNYIVPINSTTYVSNDSLLRYCHRAVDDLYYFYNYTFDGMSATTAGDFETALVESRFYRQSFVEDVSLLNQYMLNNSLNFTLYGNRLVSIQQQLDQISPVAISDSVKNETKYVTVQGTEYFRQNESSRFWVQIWKGDNTVDNALYCNATVWNPDLSILVNFQSMTFLDNGIYYYNFTVPSVDGNYIIYTKCRRSGDFWHGTGEIHVSSFVGNNLTQILNNVTPLSSQINNVQNYLIGMNQTLQAVYSGVNGIQITLMSVTSDLLNLIGITGRTENNTLYIISTLGNLTIGNVTLNVNASLSPSQVADVSEKVWLQFFTLGTPPTLPSTSLYCAANDTLVHNNTFDVCTTSGCKQYTKLVNEYCEFGCDTNNNQCVPPPVNRLFIIVAGAIVLIGLFVVVWKVMK